jgi:hypothetical protein
MAPVSCFRNDKELDGLLFEFYSVSYDVSRSPAACGAQGFPKPDRNPQSLKTIEIE